MTDAHADAVEAVGRVIANHGDCFDHGFSGCIFGMACRCRLSARDAIAAYLAHMAAAGWVMVRDVGECQGPKVLRYRLGWNACRAAMLADPAPQR